ncbi:MAG: DUF2147 domain-containing protein [Bacteroidales bacterium]|jgi:uncharacterized protein (DUF2147 family)|nr:DUF2147 domain-containing protein [Bacteroidales bacterium]NLO42240.1 DUF2147 domain-containing protein [Bacteroidales bacterium]
MKHIISFILLLNVVIGMAQNKADDIVGYYLIFDPFSNEYSQCYIYKTSKGTYDGRVCWVSNPAKKNFLNYVFLKDLRFDAENNEWVDGKVTYAGKTGTYQTYMKFEDKNKLKVRAYFGFSLLGKTLYWTKEKQKREQK